MKTLSEILKSKREAAGLSQGDVAGKLNYSTPQFVSNWERGLSAPPMYALKKLAHLYNIEDEELFQALLQHNIDRVTRDLKKKFYGNKKR
ncbi:MAG: helix-turn-helix domain-containing protein [Pseudobdellovibrionaceae bacterium]